MRLLIVDTGLIVACNRNRQAVARRLACSKAPTLLGGGYGLCKLRMVQYLSDYPCSVADNADMQGCTAAGDIGAVKRLTPRERQCHGAYSAQHIAGQAQSLPAEMLLSLQVPLAYSYPTLPTHGLTAVSMMSATACRFGDAQTAIKGKLGCNNCKHVTLYLVEGQGQARQQRSVHNGQHSAVGREWQVRQQLGRQQEALRCALQHHMFGSATKIKQAQHQPLDTVQRSHACLR